MRNLVTYGGWPGIADGGFWLNVLDKIRAKTG